MKIFQYPDLASTNDEARKLADQGHPSFTIIQADRQTSGRGRQGRAWQSLEGNLFWSMIYRPVAQAPLTASLSHIAAISIFEVILAYRGAPLPGLSLKWPNDVLLNGAKLSGILLEAGPFSPQSSHPDWLIIGVGVNLQKNPETNLRYPATNLQDQAVFNCPTANQKGYQSIDFAQHLGSKMQENIKIWEAQGLSPFLDFIHTHLYGRDQLIQISLHDQDPSARKGLLSGLTPEGYLKLKCPETARIEIITAGDVSYPPTKS